MRLKKLLKISRFPLLENITKNIWQLYFKDKFSEFFTLALSSSIHNHLHIQIFFLLIWKRDFSIFLAYPLFCAHTNIFDHPSLIDQNGIRGKTCTLKRLKEGPVRAENCLEGGEKPKDIIHIGLHIKT